MSWKSDLKAVSFLDKYTKDIFLYMLYYDNLKQLARTETKVLFKFITENKKYSLEIKTILLNRNLTEEQKNIAKNIIIEENEKENTEYYCELCDINIDRSEIPEHFILSFY